MNSPTTSMVVRRPIPLCAAASSHTASFSLAFAPSSEIAGPVPRLFGFRYSSGIMPSQKPAYRRRASPAGTATGWQRRALPGREQGWFVCRLPQSAHITTGPGGRPGKSLLLYLPIQLPCIAAAFVPALLQIRFDRVQRSRAGRVLGAFRKRARSQVAQHRHARNPHFLRNLLVARSLLPSLKDFLVALQPLLTTLLAFLFIGHPFARRPDGRRRLLQQRSGFL